MQQKSYTTNKKSLADFHGILFAIRTFDYFSPIRVSRNCQIQIKNAKDWYEGEFEQKCVKYEKEKLEKIKLSWKNDLEELKKQREEILKYMMNFWYSSNNKSKSY